MSHPFRKIEIEVVRREAQRQGLSVQSFTRLVVLGAIRRNRVEEMVRNGVELVAPGSITKTRRQLTWRNSQGSADSIWTCKEYPWWTLTKPLVMTKDRQRQWTLWMMEQYMGEMAHLVDDAKDEAEEIIMRKEQERAEGRGGDGRGAVREGG